MFFDCFLELKQQPVPLLWSQVALDPEDRGTGFFFQTN